MADERTLADLDEALRHCQAGLKALQAARQLAGETGKLYPTHVHVATVELAHAIEMSMRASLRVQ